VEGVVAEGVERVEDGEDGGVEEAVEAEEGEVQGG